MAEANQLLEGGEAKAAIPLYEIASAFPDTAGDANYGLGLCALARNDPDTATRYLARSLESQPSRADTHFYLGWSSELQGDFPAAIRKYQDTLALNPQHVVANDHLQKLEARSGGIYALLISDPSPEARQSEVLASRLETEQPARIIAHIGYYAPRLILLFVLATILEFGGIHLIQILLHTLNVRTSLTRTSATRRFTVTCIALQIIIIMYGIWVVIRASFITYRCFQGRFQIEHGIIFRHITNIDFWRVRNIDIKRSVVNKLTGDAALVFILPAELVPQPVILVHGPYGRRPPKENITAIGFGHGSGLLGDNRGRPGAYRDMLTLSTLLRALGAVKGIIQ